MQSFSKLSVFLQLCHWSLSAVASLPSLLLGHWVFWRSFTYSTTCCSKPVCSKLYSVEHKKRNLEECLCNSFPHNESSIDQGTKKKKSTMNFGQSSQLEFVYEANENQWHLVLLTPNLVGGVLITIWNVVRACTAHVLWNILLCFWSLFGIFNSPFHSLAFMKFKSLEM